MVSLISILTGVILIFAIAIAISNSNKRPLALPIFAITLFVSAFLLFVVQPMIGKMILPILGGTPQVWNTCCVFFQGVLLLGYFYTHATTNYLKPRVQMIVHGVILLVPLAILFGYMATGNDPFSVAGWEPPTGSNPVWSTLAVLAYVVGLPFFVVSTSAPLLQRWFAFSGDKTADDPYFLYVASNVGSLLSLLAYPVLFEPNLYVETQGKIWTFGFAILTILFGVSAFLIWNRVPATADAPVSDAAASNVAPDPVPAMAAPETAIQPSRMAGKRKGLKSGPAAAPAAKQTTPPRSLARPGAYDPVTAPVGWLRCIRWILLAAVPSSLMLGVTFYVSTDLSPFPFLWIIPLSLYLLSFILVFSKWPLPWTGLPHLVFLYATPFCIVLLCWAIFTGQYSPVALSTILQILFFFIITMAMHGELAKDRPALRHLTLFFLCMSVGGVLGGTFNAILAPILFTTVAEYPIAIFVACLLRPNLTPAGWIDGMLLENPNTRDAAAESSDSFAKSFGLKPTGEPFLLSYAVDVGIGLCIAVLAGVCSAYSSMFFAGLYNFLNFIGVSETTLQSPGVHGNLIIAAIYGLAMIACLIVMPRSLRFAIGVGAMLIAFNMSHSREGQIWGDRSYFGILRVLHDTQNVALRTRGGDLVFDEAKFLPAKLMTDRAATEVPYNYLMHGSTYHGRSYQIPELERLATTYYHRYGPVGAITEKYNWLPGRQNSYNADLRLPVSMIGFGANPLAMLPASQLVSVWSEPPYATVGLGTGTMASYSRWCQHVTYYEIDDKIRGFNIPPLRNGVPIREPFFLFVRDATDRGANVEIVMGDARQSLKKEEHRYKEWVKADPATRGPIPLRENYYKFLNLDAFSSDAIPVHLITEEAIALYMEKLAPDGVLMVHTSNRHMNLVAPVADICNKLKLDAIVGNDSGGESEARQVWVAKGKPQRIWSLGHYGSEYVMVARKGVLTIKGLENAVKPEVRDGVKYITSVVQWKVAKPVGGEIWSDHYQDIVSILRGIGRFGDRD